MVLPRFKLPTAPVEEKKTTETVERQGTRLVTRNVEGRIEKATTPLPPVPRIKNWRQFAREISNDGQDVIRRIYDISVGKPFRVELPDGRFSEWEVPSIEIQLAAAKTYQEMINGKAVVQTEALRAEKETEDVEQYKALSDEMLAQAARPFLERVNPVGETDAELVEEGEE